MREKSTHKKRKSDYRALIPEYNDNEILEILKKRNYYEPEAAELAIKEAIKRGLIYSENDLVAEEFRMEPLRFKLFPPIEKDHQKEKIRKSIARALVITGVIPVVWGFIRINDGIKFEGSILVLLGAIWIFLSSRIFSRVTPEIIRMLFVILAVSVIYVAKVLVSFRSIVFMDVFIPVVLFGFIVYGLIFITRMER